MKIAIFDPNLRKFTQDMIDWWEQHGHEVKIERYYNPDLVHWGDVIWFDTCDNNLKSACYPDKNDPTQDGWDLHDMDLTGKQIVCRAIDIEVWQGHHLNVDWSLVDKVLFIAQHIKDLFTKDIDMPEEKMQVIRCGIDIQKFQLSDIPGKGTEIAWVCERWPSKGIDYMLQILNMLPEDYTIHSLGVWNDMHPWEMAYFWDMVGRAKAKFTITDNVGLVSSFLKDKDFILSTSKKEAFGYSIGEGMAMGLRPIVHNFYGGKYIWPEDMMWNTVDEAAQMIQQGPGEREQWREYLVGTGLTLDNTMTQIDSWLGLDVQ